MAILFEQSSYMATFLCNHERCRSEHRVEVEEKLQAALALIQAGWIVRSPNTVDKDHERKARHYCKEHAEAHYSDGDPIPFCDGSWADLDHFQDAQAQAQAAMPNDLAVAHIKPVKTRAKKGAKARRPDAKNVRSPI